jgi:enterochelin esterase family protein
MAQTSGRVVIESFESSVLKGNRPGDPHVREVPVYLPPGYDTSSERYPVIYALTGFTGFGRTLLNRSAFSEALDQRLDRLIQTGRLRPAIVVMPDCFTRYGGSQYLDSEATGRYETHIIAELVPFIDSKYRTIPEAPQRAVMGKSSGGYGSLILGMRHPDVFGVVACHSGDMGFEYCYLPDFPPAMIQLETHGGIRGFLEQFYKKPKKSSEDFLTLNVIAMAACYSPNPEAKPHLFDLPFDLETGELLEDTWGRWLSWDPVRLVEEHESALRKLRLFLDCGTRDEFRLYAGARIYSAKLKESGIEHVHEEFEDSHRELNYRYDRSLPWISEQFSG